MITAKVKNEVIRASVRGVAVELDAEAYTGETVITPGDEAQTVPVLGKVCMSNITVGAIPSNYGKITWNGSFLTVS